VNSKNRVSVVSGSGIAYPSPPFSPHEAYPEYPFRDLSPSPNLVYGMVREALKRLKLDEERANTADWNPLGEIVQPGAKVVVKPNWVMHTNRGKGTLQSVVTHPSIVRSLLDYIFIALKGEGEVVVGDAPLQQCEIKTLWASQEWYAIPEYFSEKGPWKVVLEDWRLQTAHRKGPLTYRQQAGDPKRGFRILDLGPDSALEPVSDDWENFRVTNYDPEVMNIHHRPGKHQYCVSQRILDSDIVFNVPKLKSHAKAGFTCCLKNMVGINGHKSYLPHHRRGASTKGHDEYPGDGLLNDLHARISEQYDRLHIGPAKFSVGLAAYALRTAIRLGSGVMEGSWYGNDTLWRTILDLNRVALYANRVGALQPEPQRVVFSVVDAVVAGEGEGPLAPGDRPLGLVAAGTNPLVVDLAMAKLMGFDWKSIPQLRWGPDLTAFKLFSGDPDSVIILQGSEEASKDASSHVLSFRPAAGWKAMLGNTKARSISDK